MLDHHHQCVFKYVADTSLSILFVHIFAGTNKFMYKSIRNMTLSEPIERSFIDFEKLISSNQL